MCPRPHVTTKQHTLIPIQPKLRTTKINSGLGLTTMYCKTSYCTITKRSCYILMTHCLLKKEHSLQMIYSIIVGVSAFLLGLALQYFFGPYNMFSYCVSFTALTKHYIVTSTDPTRSHSLPICPIASTIFFLLCKQPIPLELYTIYHFTVKEVNCVLFGLASLPFLIFVIFCLCCCCIVLFL